MPGPPGRRCTERIAAIAPVAGAQAGLVTHAQLRQHGWTLDQIAHEISAGRWTRQSPTVVALTTGALTAPQRLWLGVLHAGAGAALSHITAAEEAGLQWRRDDDTVHVITAKGDLVPPLEGYFFHQTRRAYGYWLDGEASPPRLQAEHAVLLTAERDRSVRRAIGLLAAAVQQRICSPDGLLSAGIAIRKLRHGELFRLSLGDIAGGAQSFAEIDVGRLCREAGLVPPVRQRVRRDKTGRLRFLDCEWELPDGGLVVLEVDGSFHLEVANWWQDMKRERSVVIDSTRVLRCSTVEVRLEPEDIVDDLRRIGVPPAEPRAA